MSGNWTLQKDAKSAPPQQSGDILVREVYKEVLDRGMDRVWKREFNQPFPGEQFVRFRNTKRVSGKEATYLGYSGVTPENRDADDIPYASKGEGFTYEWFTRNFRQGIAMERTAIETDEIGVTKGAQRDLLTNFKRSVEYTIADAINRFLGAAGSQLLSDDGCYPVDSGRPNPVPAGGTWSNLLATGSLDEDLLFDAYLAAELQVDEYGNLYPQKIAKMIIPPERRFEMWKLLSTAKVLGSNNNDANWASSMFSMDDVIVYPYMTTDQILYLLGDPKSEDNEFLLMKRVEPTVKTWEDTGKNPDVLRQRLRASFGLAMGSPRKVWAGGYLEDAS